MVKITIKTDNSAFGDCTATEIARILRALAHQIESNGVTSLLLMDINGNKVGTYEYMEGGDK